MESENARWHAVILRNLHTIQTIHSISFHGFSDESARVPPIYCFQNSRLRVSTYVRSYLSEITLIWKSIIVILKRARRCWNYHSSIAIAIPVFGNKHFSNTTF